MSLIEKEKKKYYANFDGNKEKKATLRALLDFRKKHKMSIDTHRTPEVRLRKNPLPQIRSISWGVHGPLLGQDYRP